MLEPLLADNPILVKHVRSRLRRQEVTPVAIMVAVLGIFAVWMGSFSPSREALSFMLVVILQGFLVFVMGTSQVATQVMHARASGMLDFHRISPLPPATIVAGFLLGAPIREYALAACLIPLEMICVVKGDLRPEAMALVLISMGLLAVLYHLIALVYALVTPHVRSSGHMGVMVLLLHMFSAAGPVGYLTLLPACVLALQWSHGGGAGWPFEDPPRHFALALLHQGALIAFLAAGAVRRMRHERTPFCSKTNAILFLLVLGALSIADMEAFKLPGHARPVVAAYVLAAIGVGLAVAVTPDTQAFAVGLRRARKAGGSRPSPWADGSGNLLPLAACCAIVLATVFVAAAWAFPAGLTYPHLVAGAIAAAATVFATGSAAQAFELRFGKRGKGLLALLFFGLWVVPALIAVLAGMAGAERLQAVLLSMSPWIGIGVAFHSDAHSGVPVVVAVATAVITAGALGVMRSQTEAEAARAVLQG